MLLRRRRVLLAGASAACGVPWIAGAASSGWLIGQSAPQTGVLAASNAETTAGAKLYFSRLNARGGVHGRPIDLVSLDDGQDPKRSADNTQKLLDQGVLALGMYRTTPSIEAALPLVRKSGIAFIGSQVGPSLLYDPANSTLFNTRASYHDEVARVVRFFTQLGLTRVAVLVASDAFGLDVMVGLRNAMASAKSELVAQASIDNRSANVGAQVEQLRKANPQVVILVSNAKAAAEFVKGSRAAGFGPTFVSLSNTSAASYINDLGKAAEGVVVTQVVPTPYSNRLRVVAEFRDALVQAGSAAPPLSHASLLGFLSAKFMHEAVRVAGPNVDRGRLVQAINGAGRFDLGDYALSFSSVSRHGSRLAELTVIGKDGRFLF
jgi:ABC-type branched-subunit amino acid transport system substrate-binding protein